MGSPATTTSMVLAVVALGLTLCGSTVATTQGLHQEPSEDIAWSVHRLNSTLQNGKEYLVCRMNVTVELAEKVIVHRQEGAAGYSDIGRDEDCVLQKVPESACQTGFIQNI